jgi:hypothetical protein
VANSGDFFGSQVYTSRAAAITAAMNQFGLSNNLSANELTGIIIYNPANGGEWEVSDTLGMGSEGIQNTLSQAMQDQGWSNVMNIHTHGNLSGAELPSIEDFNNSVSTGTNSMVVTTGGSYLILNSISGANPPMIYFSPGGDTPFTLYTGPLSGPDPNDPNNPDATALYYQTWLVPGQEDNPIFK